MIGSKLYCSNNQVYMITAGNNHYPLAIVDKDGNLIDYVFDSQVQNIKEGATMFIGEPSFTTRVVRIIN